MAKIELRALSKSFAKTAVLRSLDMDVSDGEFFCLVGPSGCGKTTLLNLVAGLEQATTGRILFDGKEVQDLGPRERDIAMVFQSYALYPHKTVRENIAFPLVVRGTPKAELESRVSAMASLMGLAHVLDRRPSQLSGGQQQRVALGRALIRRPRVFLMDEPLSNLDAKLRTQVRLELKRLRQDFPVTTLYVTHDQEEAMSLSDRMAVLSGGVVQQIGTPLDVYERPANLFVAQFIGKPTMNVVEATLGGEDLRIGDGRIGLPAQLAKSLAGRTAGGKLLVGIRPEHIGLSAKGPGPMATVEVLEPMGSETWVEADWEGRKVMAKAPGLADWKPKQRVALELDPGRFHFFDPKTEARA